MCCIDCERTGIRGALVIYGMLSDTSVQCAVFSLSIDPDDPHADLYDVDDETTVITLAVRSLIDPSSEHLFIHRFRTGTTLLALRPLQ